MDDVDLQELERRVAARFPVYESRYDPLEGVAVFLVTVDESRLDEDFSALKSELDDHDFIPMLRYESGEHVIYVVHAPEKDYTKEWVNAALFVATIATTILAGALAVHSFENPAEFGFDASLAAMLSPTYLGKGALFFALPLMGILGVHEMGHFVLAKYHDVEASWPFFIPIPPFFGIPIGTMGAFISIRRPITDRKALLDIGIAGPLAGLVIAIPVVVAGAYMSAAQPNYIPDDQLTTPAGAVAAWADDHVVLAGGDAGSGPTDRIARYDPAKDAIVTLDEPLPAHVQSASGVWDGQRVLLFGGTGQASLRQDVVAYEPGGEAVTLDARLPSGRTGTSAVWTGGSALVFGGRTGPSAYTDQVLRVDPSSGEVRTSSVSLPSPRAGTAAVWTGEAAYVFGGTDGRALTEVVRVDPDVGTARVVASLPEPVSGASAVWTGQAAYLFGGGGANATGSDTILRFVPGAGVATVDASLPSPRTRTAAAWDGEAAYVFGGTNGTVRHEILRFDPGTGAVETMRGALPEEAQGQFVSLGGPILGSFGGPEVQGLLFRALTSPFPTPSSAIIHPTAFAGWVGLLVTGLNLLPAGQLDGGHIFRAFLGEKHKYASIGAVGVLLFFGAVGFGGWLVFALLVLVLGTYHPPPLNDITDLSTGRKALAVLALILLVLTFVPIPFYLPSG